MKGYPRWDDDSEDKKDGEEKEAEGDTPDTSSFSGHLMYLALGFPLDKRRSEESRHEAAKEQLGRFVGRYRSGEGAGLTIVSEGGTLVIKSSGPYRVLRGRDTRLCPQSMQECICSYA